MTDSSGSVGGTTDSSGSAGWSATALEIHRRLRELRKGDAPAVLATVVGVQGSAYRRPGAKVVLAPDKNEQVGAITAGCLEGPVEDLAETVLDRGEPLLERFDLTDDDGWGVGLGCNGIVDVFVEPVDASLDPALAELDEDEPVAIVTVVESDDPGIPVGARGVLTAGEVSDPPPERPSLPESVVEKVRPLASEHVESGDSATEEIETEHGTVRMFLDGIEPPPKLLVFGGQPDTPPLVRLAADLGFRVTVATPRSGLADPEKHPGAEAVTATRPTDLTALVDDRTSVVVMTHNLADDELAIETLAGTGVPYVGLMGPRERFEEIRENLEARGVDLPEAFLDRVATPVGLDVGGGAPVEIALSIVAEVIAVGNDREGGRLRDREGPIHGERTELPD